MENIIRRIPKRGDIVIASVAENKYKYVDLDSFNEEILPNDYQSVGVVARVTATDVLVVYKDNTSQKWSNGYSYRLGGYTLDGTARQGTLNLPATASASALTAYVISYNASSAEELVEQINAFFIADNNLKTQEWQAVLNDDNTIDIIVYLTGNYQRDATGASGFSLTANFAPYSVANSYMLRKNGRRSGEGTISNWDKALTYFRADSSSTSYNPSSKVTSTIITYPICLPAYLGTSQYRADMCEYLRGIYGEGEDGWLKCMESFLPVIEQRVGAFGEDYFDGKKLTQTLANRVFTKRDGSTLQLHPAADYTQTIGINVDGMRQGEWWLPTATELRDIIKDVKYGTTNNRDADELNRGLNKIKGKAVPNGTNWWSCCRFSSGYAWCSNGYSGFFLNLSMYYNGSVVPVSLLKIA